MWQRHLKFQFIFFSQCHGRKFPLVVTIISLVIFSLIVFTSSLTIGCVSFSFLGESILHFIQVVYHLPQANHRISASAVTCKATGWL